VSGLAKSRPRSFVSPHRKQVTPRFSSRRLKSRHPIASQRTKSRRSYRFVSSRRTKPQPSFASRPPKFISSLLLSSRQIAPSLSSRRLKSRHRFRLVAQIPLYHLHLHLPLVSLIRYIVCLSPLSIHIVTFFLAFIYSSRRNFPSRRRRQNRDITCISPNPNHVITFFSPHQVHHFHLIPSPQVCVTISSSHHVKPAPSVASHLAELRRPFLLITSSRTANFVFRANAAPLIIPSPQMALPNSLLNAPKCAITIVSSSRVATFLWSRKYSANTIHAPLSQNRVIHSSYSLRFTPTSFVPHHPSHATIIVSSPQPKLHRPFCLSLHQNGVASFVFHLIPSEFTVSPLLSPHPNVAPPLSSYSTKPRYNYHRIFSICVVSPRRIRLLRHLHHTPASPPLSRITSSLSSLRTDPRRNLPLDLSSRRTRSCPPHPPPPPPLVAPNPRHHLRLTRRIASSIFFRHEKCERSFVSRNVEICDRPTSHASNPIHEKCFASLRDTKGGHIVDAHQSERSTYVTQHRTQHEKCARH
jgi:hypothetical protein